MCGFREAQYVQFEAGREKEAAIGETRTPGKKQAVLVLGRGCTMRMQSNARSSPPFGSQSCVGAALFEMDTSKVSGRLVVGWKTRNGSAVSQLPRPNPLSTRQKQRPVC